MEPKTLKGFRDFLPEELAIRYKAIEILRKTFTSFGFQPLETPTLEYTSTLLGKYGQEADKLVYTFQDRGGRQVGLRYDLTVPVCKVLAIYGQRLPLPFKRYQIQPVFRAEKPQRGRFREFTQCDIDIFGVSSPLADAEIILVLFHALKNLGFAEFQIKINSRQVLFKILEKSGVTKPSLQLSVLQTIDKLDKKTKAEVEKELSQKGLTATQIKQIFAALAQAKPNEELKQIFTFLKISKVPQKYYCFAPSLVRGLDYYTRAIFEAQVTKPKIGSVSGGGRFDNLVAQLGGPQITGTGTSIGLERIVEVIKEHRLWPQIKPTATKILVTVFSPELLPLSLRTANWLRQKGLAVELFLDPEKKLDKQLKYADRKGIPYALIIGPEEAEKNLVTLKNLSARTQKTLPLAKLPSLV